MKCIFYRVQALLIGGDDIDISRSFCIYSVDPSGGWQSWGQGTAIGKYAPQLRKEMAKNKAKKAENMKEALSELTKIWTETCKAENVNLGADDEYQALLLQKSFDGCNLFVVDEEKVTEIVNRHIRADSS